MSTEKVNDDNLDSEESPDRVPDGESSIFDQEVSELNSVMEDFDRVMSMPDVQEEFRPVLGRAARRKAEKRNRALMKRKPNG